MFQILGVTFLGDGSLVGGTEIGAVLGGVIGVGVGVGVNEGLSAMGDR